LLYYEAVRVMSQSLCITLLLTAFAFSAESQEKLVRNIVLVQGAWADGSGWKGVYDVLVKDGYNGQHTAWNSDSYT
jgi:hypothetical protein